MKSIIAYYSYTGHAEKIAKAFARSLESRGTARLERLRPVQEITSFVGQCRAAFGRKRTALQPAVTADLSGYDLVVIGCPVWAFAPVPAVNTYLDSINGVQGKRAIVFLTSGSGAGVNRCFAAIRKTLESKGIVHVGELNIPDRMSKDDEFIDASIGRVLAETVI